MKQKDREKLHRLLNQMQLEEAGLSREIAHAIAFNTYYKPTEVIAVTCGLVDCIGKSFYVIGEAVKKVADMLREATEILRRSMFPYEGDIIGSVVINGLPDLQKRTHRPIPPRRAVARGLSPVQCRYWVNYKARDKLPRTARKTPAMRTGGQGHAEKQKAGASGRRGCH